MVIEVAKNAKHEVTHTVLNRHYSTGLALAILSVGAVGTVGYGIGHHNGKEQGNEQGMERCLNNGSSDRLVGSFTVTQADMPALRQGVYEGPDTNYVSDNNPNRRIIGKMDAILGKVPNNRQVTVSVQLPGNSALVTQNYDGKNQAGIRPSFDTPARQQADGADATTIDTYLSERYTYGGYGNVTVEAVSDNTAIELSANQVAEISVRAAVSCDGIAP